jgi:hypothetical protein
MLFLVTWCTPRTTSPDTTHSISQKALGTLAEDGDVMPKHVGATIYNY